MAASSGRLVPSTVALFASAGGFLLSLRTVLQLRGSWACLVAPGSAAGTALIGALIAALLACASLAALLVVRSVRRRDADLGWGSLRGLFYGAVLSAFLHGALAESYHWIVARTWFCAGLGAWSGSVVLLAFAGRLRRSRAIRATDVFLMNVCLVLVAGEVSMRVASRLLPSPLLQRVDASARDMIDLYRRRPGSTQLGFPFNRSGYYDVEESEIDSNGRLVVSIGDSMGLWQMPHELVYSTVCERAQDRLEVYNMNVIAIGPREYAYLTRHEALRLDPEMIVVSLYFGNDVAPLLSRDRDVLRGLFDREELLVVQVPRRLIGIGDRLRTRTDGDGRGEIYSTEEALARHGRLLEHSAACAGRETTASLESVEENLNLLCASDDYERALLEALGSIVDAAGRVPIAFLLIPAPGQVEDHLWQAVAGDPDSPRLDRSLPQRRVAAWLDARGVPYLDLLPHFLDVPLAEGGLRHLYCGDDHHFSIRAHELTGRALSDFLTRRVPPR